MSGSAQLTEDQRKHLEFIQSAITRMSGLSSTAKGWGITVSMAAFGISAAGSVPLFSVLGLTSMGFFTYLDCRYLREERLFRCLYEDARRGLLQVYSMDRSAYLERCSWRSVFKSWSIVGFYAPSALVGAGSLVWSAA
ncbi:hypothetical protein SAMN05216298_4941 [Glycomyces sambucus]|uniref:SMODS and SLOG-associating 2TM effector domain-containing protein n=1 Tax=Glycomyces sambucus TaxID=380244 RepID=A0A1G9MFA6_9ACTN|nr:hypothetical protein SAMN05216298_4941 [Glycomyces sambucus]